MGAIEGIHIGLVRKVGVGGAFVTVISIIAAAFVDGRLAVGITIGGGLILLLYMVYAVLAPAMLGAPTKRRSRVVFWLVWALKWPIIGTALYLGFRSGAASPLGVAIGAGIIPVVAVLIVIWALLVDSWSRKQRGVHAS